MKKILLIFALLFTVSINAEEFVSVTDLEWKDFAPPAYIDVEEPKGIGKLNETAKYWYKRKVEFENECEKCRNLEYDEAKYTCYQDLKVKQYQKNSDYNARLEAIDNARLGPQEMYDRTDNMLPIGGYLNTFTRFQPNELR